MGIVDDIIANSGKDIVESLGYLEDITKESSYSKVMGKLNEIGKRQADVKRYGDIVTKLQMYDPESVPTEKDIEGVTFNPNHPDFQMPDKSENPTIKKYYEYASAFDEKNDDGTPKYQGEKLDFTKWLETMDPDGTTLKTGLTPSHFQKTTKKEIMTPEEYEAKIFESVGLDPVADREFYKQNKGKLSTIDEYNAEIKNYLAQVYPAMISKYGKMGDIYQKLSEGRGKDLMLQAPTLPEKKMKYTVQDDKVVAINENTGSIKITPLEKKKKSDPNKWEMFTDDTGEYTGEKGKKFWGEREQDENGEWKIVFRDDLNKQELDDENFRITNRDVTLSKKMNTGRKTGRKLGSGKKHIDFSDYKKEDFKKITKDQLDNMDANELAQLEKYSDYLNKDVRDALENEDSPVNERDEAREDYYEDPRTAENMKKVDDAIAAIIKKWERDNLTVEEWTSELSKFQFSPEEKELLSEVYGISL